MIYLLQPEHFAIDKESFVALRFLSTLKEQSTPMAQVTSAPNFPSITDIIARVPAACKREFIALRHVPITS